MKTSPGFENGFWVEPMEDVLRLALSGTEKVVHSSSAMLYGALDNGFDSKDPDFAFGEETVALTWWDCREGNEQLYIAALHFDLLKQDLQSYAPRKR